MSTRTAKWVRRLLVIVQAACIAVLLHGRTGWAWVATVAVLIVLMTASALCQLVDEDNR